jgi:soluble P-type ATPase
MAVLLYAAHNLVSALAALGVGALGDRRSKVGVLLGQAKLAREAGLANNTVAAGYLEQLEELAGSMSLHVLTADTFGTVEAELSGIPCKLTILPGQNQAEAKLSYVKAVGAERTACLGNGRNDRLMLEEAALGIVISQDEGTAVEALLAADVVCPSVATALELLRKPLWLAATLRA